MRNIWICLGLALLLCGCPKREQAAVDTEQPRRAVQLDIDSTVDPSAPADTDASGSRADAGATTSSATQSAGMIGPVTPTEDTLPGKWFALYGRTGVQQGLYTYEDGHILQIFPDHNALIIMRNGGSAGEQLTSGWELSDSRLTLTAQSSEATAGRFGTHSPMAFGRDSEIGLASAGRDSEIGLAEGEHVAQQGQYVMGMKATLDGDYLILESQNGGNFMVYGRVDNAYAAGAPALTGDWMGEVAAGQSSEAQLKQQGDTLTLTYGPNNSVFSGRFTQGFYVGELRSTAGGGSAFAVLSPVGEGLLNGVVTPFPFAAVNTTYDFHKVEDPQ